MVTPATAMPSISVEGTTKAAVERAITSLFERVIELRGTLSGDRHRVLRRRTCRSSICRSSPAKRLKRVFEGRLLNPGNLRHQASRCWLSGVPDTTLAQPVSCPRHGSTQAIATRY